MAPVRLTAALPAMVSAPEPAGLARVNGNAPVAVNEPAYEPRVRVREAVKVRVEAALATGPVTVKPVVADAAKNTLSMMETPARPRLPVPVMAPEPPVTLSTAELLPSVSVVPEATVKIEPMATVAPAPAAVKARVPEPVTPRAEARVRVVDAATLTVPAKVALEATVMLAGPDTAALDRRTALVPARLRVPAQAFRVGRVSAPEVVSSTVVVADGPWNVPVKAVVTTGLRRVQPFRRTTPVPAPNVADADTPAPSSKVEPEAAVMVPVL